MGTRPKAGDLYEGPGSTVRVDRVYYHEGGRCWVVEYHRHPAMGTKDIHWEPEREFLKTVRWVGCSFPCSRRRATARPNVGIAHG